MDHPVVKKLQKYYGIDKPYALEWGGWTIWKNKVKSEKPFAYFLTETVPNFLDDLVYDVTEIWNVLFVMCVIVTLTAHILCLLT